MDSDYAAPPTGLAISALTPANRGYITVSSIGLNTTPSSGLPNAGYDFGPDTTLGATTLGTVGGTTLTTGVQEAVNYANANKITDIWFYSVGTTLPFSIKTTLTLPAGGFWWWHGEGNDASSRGTVIRAESGLVGLDMIAWDNPATLTKLCRFTGIRFFANNVAIANMLNLAYTGTEASSGFIWDGCSFDGGQSAGATAMTGNLIQHDKLEDWHFNNCIFQNGPFKSVAVAGGVFWSQCRQIGGNGSTAAPCVFTVNVQLWGATDCVFGDLIDVIGISSPKTVIDLKTTYHNGAQFSQGGELRNNSAQPIFVNIYGGEWYTPQSGGAIAPFFFGTGTINVIAQGTCFKCNGAANPTGAMNQAGGGYFNTDASCQFVNLTAPTFGVAGPTAPTLGLGTSAASTAAAPGTAASTTRTMLGLAQAFTPNLTGKLLILVSGTATNSTAADGFLAQIATGTGTAPVNGAALTGTVRGNTATVTQVGVISAKYAFTCQAIVTGQTAGTAIWVDLQVATVTGGTATFSQVQVAVVELLA